MSESTQPPSESKRRAQAFSALISDQRISHGAFRAWHCLRDHQNKQTGRCDPGQRRIAARIGCDPHSLTGWLAELVATGWLRILPAKRGQTSQYELLDGSGKVLGKSTSVSDVNNPNTSDVGFRMGKSTTKLSSPKGLLKKKTDITAPLDGNALEAQPSAGGKSKGAGCTGRF